MRFSAPMLVAVFVSGILLLIDGPGSRDQLLTLHKVSFIVWLVYTGLHLLWHLPRLSAPSAPPAPMVN